MRFGILPQVLRVMLSRALYAFESNTCTATSLGLVGADGIGSRSRSISRRSIEIRWPSSEP